MYTPETRGRAPAARIQHKANLRYSFSRTDASSQMLAAEEYAGDEDLATSWRQQEQSGKLTARRLAQEKRLASSEKRLVSSEKAGEQR